MLNDREKIIILGGMSGSSLNGLDLALTEFTEINGQTDWQLIDKHHILFPKQLKEDLKKTPKGSALDLAKLDYHFGYFIGEECKIFIGERGVHYISFHGRSIFHNPEQGMICQIGNVSLRLLKRLLDQTYFRKNPPKTLDNSYKHENFIPRLDAFEISLDDKLKTVTEMIVQIIKKEIINPKTMYLHQ